MYKIYIENSDSYKTELIMCLFRYLFSKTYFALRKKFVMEGLPELKPLWERPADVKFPNVWHRFETKPKNGKVYKIRVEDLTEERTAEVIEFLMKYYFPEEPLSV